MSRTPDLQTERLGFPIQVKLADGDQGLIEGYGSTFDGLPDAHGDLVAPGAFAKSLSTNRAAGRNVAMLWTHNPAEPIGKWTDLTEDSFGLKVAGRLNMNVARAREAYELAKDGVLALSIGYRPEQSERTKAGGRLLKEISLFEISLVATPSQPAARITGVKSAFDPKQITDPRAFEEFLREAGFSRAFAKAVTASGFKAASGRCEDDEGVDELAEILRLHTAEIVQFTKGVTQ